MYRKGLILLTVLMLTTSAITFADAEAEEQGLKTVKVRDPRTGKMLTKQVPVAKKSDPYENTSVLVEAFVVRVSTDALAEAGVNPIGQSPEGISVLKILWCLKDKENAEVVSGAKVTACHNNRASFNNKKTTYLKFNQETEEDFTKQPKPAVITRSVTINAYNSGQAFKIVPHIQKDNRIRIESTFSYSGFLENDDPVIPPDQMDYDWSGVVTMSSGNPIIAGATQNDETATFLILTATIQDS